MRTALGVGIATMEKRYTGAVEGRSNTLFTSAFDPERGIGTYVALESFEGSLDGRTGTFNFVHAASTSGTDRSGEHFLIVAVERHGDLAGIRRRRARDRRRRHAPDAVRLHARLSARALGVLLRGERREGQELLAHHQQVAPREQPVAYSPHSGWSVPSRG